jgi:hypothetical protein
VDRSEWIEAFAAELGVPPPDEPTVDRLLALAATAAHQSERTAAPIACYLVGLTETPVADADRRAATINPSGDPLADER